MQKVTLYIETPRNRQTVALEDELSIGRTGAATVALDDTGLSRVNTTVFRDGDIVYALDEGSLNGTFLNGQRLAANPERLLDGDILTLGSETRVRVEISQTEMAAAGSGSRQSETATQKPVIETPAANPKSQIPNPKSNKPPMILILAAGSAFFIIFISLIGILVVNLGEKESRAGRKASTRKTINLTIPIRVVDPMGGRVIDDLDELVQAWEVQDAEFKEEDLQPVTTSTDAPQLTVTVADWAAQRSKAMERRNAPVGLVSGVIIPPELTGGIGKQLAIFPKYGITRETLPRDYISLAQKRMNNELIELPLATELYYLDNIGTSADSSPFYLFDINTKNKSPLTPDSEGMTILQRLAGNFSGQKYDISNASDRLQMKRRLLRMFHPEAKTILEEIARAYHQKFGRPLKITSLTRSLEYQYDLTKATSNAYRGATPPHSTGRTFDMAYMHMTKDEQNFVMEEIAKLERAGKVDALHERGQTPCIHIFVFPGAAAAKL